VFLRKLVAVAVEMVEDRDKPPDYQHRGIQVEHGPVAVAVAAVVLVESVLTRRPV
jgi:hypothetical protein